MRTLILILLSVYAFNIYAAGNQDIDKLNMTLYKMYVSENEDCSNLTEIVDYGETGKTVDMVSNPDFGEITVATGTYRCIALTVDRRLEFQPQSVPAGAGNCTAGAFNDSYIGSTSLLAESYTSSTFSLTFDKNDVITGITDYEWNGGTLKWSSYDQIFAAGGGWRPNDLTWANAALGQTAAGGIPINRATLYLSTKTRTVTGENQFAPLWAYYMEEDGDTIVGNGTKIFDWGADQDDMGAYIANPLVITSSNIAKFIVRFKSGVDTVENNVAGECHIKNVEFDFEQLQ